MEDLASSIFHFPPHNDWSFDLNISRISAYLVKREAVIIIQTNYRALRYRIQFKRKRRAAITIQVILFLWNQDKFVQVK